MNIRRRVDRLILLGALCLVTAIHGRAEDRYQQPFDCFAVVVGRNASADGSVITAHNEDVDAPAVRCYKVPPLTHESRERIILREGGRVPQAGKTLGYLWINVPGWDVCDSYVNESGVTVSSDGCPSREDRPELVDGGIVFWLRRIVAERARTAREGVTIAGALIDTFGYASSGRSYVIADKNEAWVLAVVNGKHWVAQRVPDDRVVVIANCFTVQGVNLKDTANFLGSPDIVEYAVKRGWYVPARDGEFNFAKAYANPGSLFHPGNIYRQWSGIHRISGKNLDPLTQLPFAVEPDRKLTVQDVMAVLRDHFEGTPRDSSAGGTAGDPHQMNDPTICADGTRYSFVASLRRGLPAAIAPVVWLALHHPDVQGYGAWYPGITRVPSIYAVGDYASALRWHLGPSFSLKKTKVPEAFTRSVALNDRVRRAFTVNYPPVKNAWRAFEAENFKRQQEFEQTVLNLPPEASAKIPSMLDERTAAQGCELYDRAGALMKGLK